MQRQSRLISPLRRIVRALCTNDPDMIEVILCGSGAYAPRLMRDIDLIVTTRARKPDAVYWQAADAVDVNVDILVRARRGDWTGRVAD